MGRRRVNIGNRKTAQEDAESVTYEANELNQYTDITTGEENFIPKYDRDGNQTRIRTSTGIWTAAYNAQNRPTRFTRENADGTRTVITAAYDYLSRRAWKKVETIATDPETGEETATVTLHQRYIYRGYLQVAACDLTRGGHPSLWLIMWDPTQPIATRPMAIQKDGTWYCYGWDLTKNVCEIFGAAGYIRTAYAYTPYGAVTEEGDVTQPIQWSSEYADLELGLTYYNYRHYNPMDGRWMTVDAPEWGGANLYTAYENTPPGEIDELGHISFSQRQIPPRTTQQVSQQSSANDAHVCQCCETYIAEEKKAHAATLELLKEKGCNVEIRCVKDYKWIAARAAGARACDSRIYVKCDDMKKAREVNALKHELQHAMDACNHELDNRDCFGSICSEIRTYKTASYSDWKHTERLKKIIKKRVKKSVKDLCKQLGKSTEFEQNFDKVFDERYEKCIKGY